jgi:hypothetical protein
MTVRYEHLLKEIDRVKPKTIVEIGTWKGVRAQQLIARAMKYQDYVSYKGFDLFEDLTPEVKVEEFNGKTYTSVEEAAKNISKVTENYTLIKGNTRQTIKEFFGKRYKPTVDFIFIDGGHSFETIESDWNACKELMHKDTVVLFDDYYIGPQAKDYGSQKLLRQLCLDYHFPLSGDPPDKYVVDILEPGDTLSDGTTVNIVRVTKCQ